MALPITGPAPGAPPQMGAPNPRPTGDIPAGPPGPGAPSMMATGPGAGNEAAADGLISAIIPTLHKALSAYPPGSKKYQGVLNAIKSLTPSFSREQTQGLVPSSIQQLAMNAHRGGPMQTGPGPGIQPSPPKGMPEPEPMGAGAAMGA